jgi:hypothetical protein
MPLKAIQRSCSCILLMVQQSCHVSHIPSAPEARAPGTARSAPPNCQLAFSGMSAWTAQVEPGRQTASTGHTHQYLSRYDWHLCVWWQMGSWHAALLQAAVHLTCIFCSAASPKLLPLVPRDALTKATYTDSSAFVQPNPLSLQDDTTSMPHADMHFTVGDQAVAACRVAGHRAALGCSMPDPPA